MRLCLINPSNPLVSMTERSRWRRYRIWQPLGLMTVAALTPPEWDVALLDENVALPDYGSLPRPDLVGLTAFTSQASRAYAIAAQFRAAGVPVVMGGIHATACAHEALRAVDAVVLGEAESVWAKVLADAARGALERRYEGELSDLASSPPARHDLLPSSYAFGVIQTTRGCPLHCHFCSVSHFNGQQYRHRPIDAVVREFQALPERRVLIVNDNLIGTRTEHVTRAKELFRALIAANVRKRWVCQATINMAEDEELLRLARRAGCFGVFVGFESPSDEGLLELGKRFNILKGDDLRGSVRRLHRHGIAVAGSFILGLDCDRPGIGDRIARAAEECALDFVNVLFLTPLPGTRLWSRMEAEGRIVVDRFPEDWRYYTLNFPVARYGNLSWADLRRELTDCWRRFYAPGRILRRLARSALQGRDPLPVLVGNLSYRRNYAADDRALATLIAARPCAAAVAPSVLPAPAAARSPDALSAAAPARR